jgi:cathepsin L
MNRYRSLLVASLVLLMVAVWLIPSASTQSTSNPQPNTIAAQPPAEFAQRERQAPQHIKNTLAQLRREIQEQRLAFEVGYTLALDRPLEQIAGLHPPANLGALAQRQNALAEQLVRVDTAARDEYAKLNPRVKLPELTLSCNARLAAFDWRRLGKVTGVRDQGACGSCWDFATMAAYESSYLIRNGGSPDSSEQEVLDCNPWGYSCTGGWWAFDYAITKAAGTEASYPYAAHKGTCRSVADTYWAVAWGYVAAGGGTPSVADMKQALCERGPLAVAVRATPAFQAYTGGLFNQHDTGSINHGVLLIGWDDSKGAWLIKNSWGTMWGNNCGYGTERGYMWIAYGSNSIGSAAAWVRARNRTYVLPRKYYELMPQIKPVEP